MVTKREAGLSRMYSGGFICPRFTCLRVCFSGGQTLAHSVQRWVSARCEPMYRFLEYTVEQYMTSAVKTVTQNNTLWDLERLFEEHDFNAFPVVDDGHLLGVVTKFDFIKAFAFTSKQILPHYDELMSRPVGEVMTEAVVSVAPDAPLPRALQLMVNLKAGSFPVVTGEGQLVGMITRKDILRALKEAVYTDT
jgi:CBS domain-containing protein